MVEVVEVAFEVAAWRESRDAEYRQPYADGDAIAWISETLGPSPRQDLVLQACSGDASVVASRDYGAGQIDVPVLDAGEVVWLDWDARGSGSWVIRAASADDAAPRIVLSSEGRLPEAGAAGRRPIVPEPMVDGGRFITWIRSSEADATDLVVGDLEGEVTQVTSRAPDGGTQVGPAVEVSGHRGVFAQRELSIGQWTWNVWLVDLDTLALTRLTDAVSLGVTYELPAISGEWAAFVEATPGPTATTYTPMLLNVDSGERIELSPSVSDSTTSISNIEIGRAWVIWTTSDGTYFARLDEPRRVYFVDGLVPRHAELDGDNFTWWDSKRDSASGELIGNSLFWVRLPD